MKPERNAPCSCGSGKKFKHCCERRIASLPRMPSPAEINPLIALFNTGRYADLENQVRALLVPYPSAGILWQLLGGLASNARQRRITCLSKDGGAIA